MKQRAYQADNAARRQLIGGGAGTSVAPTLPPLLLPIAAVAQRLNILPREVRDLVKGGKIPAPLKLGGRTLWKTEVIDYWVQLGCPSAAEFAQQAHAASPQLHGKEDVPPLLWSVTVVAARLSISTRQVRRLIKLGRMPAPLKLGGRTLWQPEGIDLWVKMGCPSAAEFAARRAAGDH